MERQNSFYTQNLQGLDQNMGVLSDYCMPRQASRGGEAMQFSRSDESTNSARSIFSNTGSSWGNSPSTMSYGTTPSPIEHEYKYTNSTIPSDPLNSNYGIFNNTIGPFGGGFEPQQQEQQYSSSQQQEHHTPTSLGWLPGTDLLNLYEFVVLRGKEPYFELVHPWTPTIQTPRRVYLDTGNREKGVYPCKFPNGCTKRFSRPADLERHCKNVHAGLSQKDCHKCDYPNCARSKDGDQFTRKDHYRDHIKDYHKEDIGQAKGGKNKDKQKFQEDQQIWLAERQIDPKWWRCARCLERVYVKIGGWDCETCKLACEPDRVERRKRLQGKEDRKEIRRQKQEPVSSDSTNSYSTCATCSYQGWIQDMNGQWELCYECQTPAQASIPPYLLDQTYNTSSNYSTNYSY